MNKSPQWSRKANNKATTLVSSCELISVFADPVAKLLKGMILNEYDGDRLMRDYENGIALIENGGIPAREVIDHTIALVRNVDPAIEFTWTDFRKHHPARYNQKTIAKLNRLIALNEKDTFTINVLENVADCLIDKETCRNFEKVFFNLDFYSIMIFNQESYRLFSEKIDRQSEVCRVWINRQPGELDFFQKDQKHSHERCRPVYINNAIFTAEALTVIDRARVETELMDDDEISPFALIMAAAEGKESGLALIQCHNLSEDMLSLIRQYPFEPFKHLKDENAYLYDLSGVEIIKNAVKLASVNGYPDHNNPGLVSDFHIFSSLAISDYNSPFGPGRRLTFDAAVRKIADWYFRKKVSPTINHQADVYGKIGILKGLCRELRGTIFGQNLALDALREILNNAYIKSGDSVEYNCPKGNMLFLGPDGVGKLHLARTFAEKAGYPFFSYDMLLFNEGDLPELCSLVKDNHSAVFVFENIEQAHSSMIKVLCEIIDHGRLIGKISGEEFDFRQTIIIFTACLDRFPGNLLVVPDGYDRFQKIQSSSIQNTLKQELDSLTGKTLLPPELSLRITKGQLVLFNDLQIEDLLNICENKLIQQAGLIEKNAGKIVTYDPLINFTIICAEGGRPAPRVIHSAVENLLNREIEKFVDGKSSNSAEIILTEYDKIHFALPKEKEMDLEISNLYYPERKPRVLLLTSQKNAELYTSYINTVEWHPAYSLTAIDTIEEIKNFDFALLDLWFNDQCTRAEKENIIKNFTDYSGLDITRLPLPVISQVMLGDKYQSMISDISKRLPVIMLNIIDDAWDRYAFEGTNRATSAYLEAAEQLRIIQGERSHRYPLRNSFFRYDLFFEYLVSIKSRGFVNTVFSVNNFDSGTELGLSKGKPNLREELIREFGASIDAIHQKLHREKMASELSCRKEALCFESEWVIDDKYKLVKVRLKNMRIAEI